MPIKLYVWPERVGTLSTPAANGANGFAVMSVSIFSL
jgi:hypothetical protein